MRGFRHLLTQLIFLLSFFVITSGVFLVSSVSNAQEELLVYSARKEHLVKPLFERYEKMTGIKVKYITDKAPALIARLKAEGKRTPADILFTVDAGNLWHAANTGMLSEIDSKTLNALVPSHLQDPKKRWFALTIRARTIAYHPDRVKIADLDNYAGLADKKWNKRLCLRTAKKVYNQSLVAMLIAQEGLAKTEQILTGWVNNLATKVFSNDTAVIRAIESGQCDVGIVNSYYYAAELKKQKELKTKLFWPNKADGGTHVNISGAGIVKYSKKADKAQKLLEWLASDEAQIMFSQLNFEFPIRAEVKASEVTKNWGRFDQSLGNLNEAGANQAAAVKLMDKVGYR